MSESNSNKSESNGRKPLNAAQQKQAVKLLQGYMTLNEERKSFKVREAALAKELYDLLGSSKITLAKSGLEIAAIRKRESEEGVEPVEYSYYMKHYGEKQPSNAFDL